MAGHLLQRNAPAPYLILQRRLLHAALLAPGLADALAALPGAGKDKQGHITIPVPDPRLQVLAQLERTKPVPATVEVADLGKELAEELARIAEERLETGAQQTEFSGKLLASLRSSDAIILAVPCPGESGADDPVRWFNAAEKALVSADLQALEQQVCKNGDTGIDAELDAAKLRKSLANAKDPTVKRAADELTADVLVPGLTALRARLLAGIPAREARLGLGRTAEAGQAEFQALDPRFGELARGFLNVLVTWQPLLVVADVPELDAADALSTDVTDTPRPAGNAASQRLSYHVRKMGVPCLVACTTLEGEHVALKEEPEFLAEYLASFGLREGIHSDNMPANSTTLRCWHSQSGELTRRIPNLLNLLTYYTAGEKEARAWLCPRLRKDTSPLPYSLLGLDENVVSSGKAGGSKGASQNAKSGLPSSVHEQGVPAFLAARAIHTSFETRVKAVSLWKFEDLAAFEPLASGPGGKDRAKVAGKMQKLARDGLLEEGDVVEFVLT